MLSVSQLQRFSIVTTKQILCYYYIISLLLHNIDVIIIVTSNNFPPHIRYNNRENDCVSISYVELELLSQSNLKKIII